MTGIAETPVPAADARPADPVPAGADDEASDALREEVHEAARKARVAARELALLTGDKKNEVLLAVADAVVAAEAGILAANAEDVEEQAAEGTPEAMLDRLRLSPQRLMGMASGLRQVAGLADPIGEVVAGSTRPNGLRLTQVRVPLGVVGMIYEGRPNVTVDAFGLAFKSGNAALLRGSRSARRSNGALVAVIRGVLSEYGVSPDACHLLPSEDRASVTHLIRARGLVDVVIPRGGAGLIRAVVEGATVPAIETGTGNCHLFVDASADVAMAVNVVVNAKAHRCSVCNALETILVHRDVAAAFWAQALDALNEAGVQVHGDEATRSHGATVVAIEAGEYDAEYLSMDLAAKQVDSLDEALEHIRQYSTGHSETIMTSDRSAAQRFTAEVDAAAVLVNTSSRFVDGGEFGFGAEIGISTQKLHARGPMGLSEMTSTKYIIEGDGQIRA